MVECDSSSLIGEEKKMLSELEPHGRGDVAVKPKGGVHLLANFLYPLKKTLYGWAGIRLK